MRSRTSCGLAVAAPFLAIFTSALAQSAGQMSEGCFTDSTGLTKSDSFTYQSILHCSSQCSGKAVMAFTQGSDCYCGDKLPPADSKTSDSNCNSKCTGYGADMCGGPNAFSVFLTGTNSNPGSVSSSSSSSNSNSNPDSNSQSSSNSNSKSNSNSNVNSNANAAAASSATSSTTSSTTSSPTPATTARESPSVVTPHASTIVVTAPGQSQAQTSVVTTTETPKSGSKPNVAGIAAGVVVGVVALCAIAGGLFFYLRNRKRRAVEEAYRTNAANSYNMKAPVSSAGSTNDSRLEPSVMMQRRQSDGSIADNQDYSRRILKVTNA